MLFSDTMRFKKGQFNPAICRNCGCPQSVHWDINKLMCPEIDDAPQENKEEIVFSGGYMSGVKWVVEADSERECYRILTAIPVIEHDGVEERQWIADVFEQSDAIAITNIHNATLASVVENFTDNQQRKDKITPHICSRIERCHNVGGKNCGSHQPCYRV